MENSQEKEKDRNATEWLTKPIYKILIVGLVILELFEKEIDEGEKHAVQIVLGIGLGLIVIINVANVFLFFGKKNKPSVKNSDAPEEEN